MACSTHGDVFGLGHCLRNTGAEGAEFFVLAAGDDKGWNVDGSEFTPQRLLASGACVAERFCEADTAIALSRCEVGGAWPKTGEQRKGHPSL